MRERDLEKRGGGGNISLYFHCDEDGPQEDSLKRPAIGHPEDKKRTCEDMCRPKRTQEDTRGQPHRSVPKVIYSNISTRSAEYTMHTTER
jgi:hypothetical protein